ncbi:MAG: rRNA adenine N-6-methyltransferase family protein [Nanoarchaeota archaeon]|nr:rRNA adenine N-6-methyltransferase family protein [Nanoarchaeota archaeon]
MKYAHFHMESQDLNTLNQFFIIKKEIINDIIKAGELKKQDIVLEIGPGKGGLTRELAKHVKKVIAIEKDESLKDSLTGLPENIDLIFQDAKKYILKNPDSFNKIISSPPYNILEPLLHIMISMDNIDLIVLAVPKYFLENMEKNPIFSSFFEFKNIKEIKKEYFSPIPRIDSEIIKITKKKTETDKEYLIKSLYDMQDIKLKNALRSLFIEYNHERKNQPLTKKQAKELINKLNIPKKILEKNISSIPIPWFNKIPDMILMYRTEVIEL